MSPCQSITEEIDKKIYKCVIKLSHDYYFFSFRPEIPTFYLQVPNRWKRSDFFNWILMIPSFTRENISIEIMTVKILHLGLIDSMYNQCENITRIITGIFSNFKKENLTISLILITLFFFKLNYCIKYFYFFLLHLKNHEILKVVWKQRKEEIIEYVSSSWISLYFTYSLHCILEATVKITFSQFATL